MTEADRLLEIELGETLLSSLLGLAALRLRRLSHDEASGVLADLQGGRGALRFVVDASGLGARIDGALVSPGTGLTKNLLSLNLVPSQPEPAPSDPSDSAAERLGAVFHALGESSLASHIPAAERQWLRDAIKAKVQKGGSLDHHAGLAARGVKDLPAVLDMYNRDQELMAALKAVAVEGVTVGEWERCTRLAPLIKTFARVDWPRAYNLLQPPADWPGWKAALFRAAKCAHGSTRRDPKLPLTPQGLHRVVKSNTPFSVTSPGVKVLAQHRRTDASDQT